MGDIAYLNIDLDLTSKNDISTLINELEKTFVVSRNDSENDTYYASFLGNGGFTENATLEVYKNAFNELSSEAKILWNQCDEITLDIGFESGTAPNNFHSIISKESISALKLMGAELVITIYPLR